MKFAFCLATGFLATGCASVFYGGIAPEVWGACLLSVGLGSLIYAARASVKEPFAATELVAIYFLLLLCLYSAFQLLPLPPAVLWLLDPTRAEVARGLQGISSAQMIPAPVSIDPGKSCLYISWIVGETLTFLLIREAVRRAGSKWAVTIPLLILGGFEALLGIQQHSTGAQAVVGTNDNKDHLAGFLEMTFPFAVMYGFVLLRRGHERSLRLGNILRACFFWGLAAAMLVAIMFTRSKLGFISTLGSLFLIGAIIIGCKLSGPARWIAVAGLAGLLLSVFVFLPPDELANDFISLSSDQTGEGRFPIWKDTLRLIADYPLFGSGLGTYFPAFMRYQTYGVDMAWVSAHNDYLEFASELGLAGFLLLAGFVCMVLVCAVRAAVYGTSGEIRLLGLACAGGMTAILIHSAADFNMHIPANALVLAWIAGTAVALPAGSTKLQRKPPFGILVRAFLLVWGCLAALYGAEWLLYLHQFQGDLKAERLFCRFGVCDTYQVARTLHQQYGAAATVPPGPLLELLRRDPAGAYRWEDLGQSLQSGGRTDEARYCIERAVALSPQIPTILAPAAQFYFLHGDKARGMELMRRILERSPDRLDFDDYGQGVTLEEILRNGLPPNPYVWRSAMHLKIQKDQLADAANVWDALLPRGYADDRLTNEYVRFLLQNQHPEAAAQAWASYAGSRDRAYPATNRVFNGDFEVDPAPSPFDWTLDPTPGARFDFDRQTVHSGARALRVQFDGTQNLTSLGVHQSVFLTPGRYRFSAYVRARDLSTDEGVAFRVADEQAPNRLSFTTEAVLGTTDWKLVQHLFQAPPGTGPVEIRLVRASSLRFDNLIKGVLWVDQVSIQPER